MNLVVVVQDYPSPQRPSVTAFVHSRNLWYREHGVTVDVASFSANRGYEHEGVRVWPFRTAPFAECDVVAAHAPNIRNHVRSLWNMRLPIAFFFHGFEVLHTRSYYPTPFEHQQRWHEPLRRIAQGGYDVFKLRMMSTFLHRAHKGVCAYIFVSRWMRQQFLSCVPDAASIIKSRDHVIPNAVHESFVNEYFQPPRHPEGDFVTFRPSIDTPKYGIDLVMKMAKLNPDLRFDVFGRGRLIQQMDKPPNLRHFDEVVPQTEMVRRAGRYQAALLPSRLDSQGVTACEMATFGIPTIVSDIPVARDVLGDFPNVGFVNNDGDGLKSLLDDLSRRPTPTQRADFLPSTTCSAELAIFRNLATSAGRSQHVDARA